MDIKYNNTSCIRFIAECVSEYIFFKFVNIWQSCMQKRDCLVHFACLANALLKDEESARDNHVFACNLKFFQIFTDLKKSFTFGLSNKPFLIWLLTTPTHFKYAVTLLCNLSLMACFADINVS